MRTLLIVLVIAVPILMAVAVQALALARAADKPTPPVTGPVGLDEERHDQ